VADEFDLTTTWREVEALLPTGWHLDGLRCASTGLRPEDRSVEWIVVAIDASGAEIQHRAATPDAALCELPDRVQRS